MAVEEPADEVKVAGTATPDASMVSQPAVGSVMHVRWNKRASTPSNAVLSGRAEIAQDAKAAPREQEGRDESYTAAIAMPRTVGADSSFCAP
jgi:hypothetical protein